MLKSQATRDRSSASILRNKWMSWTLLVVAYPLYSRVMTTFLFAKVASAGMTAKHRFPIFPDSLWQTSHFITKMGIPYTLPKNYLLFIPMALTAYLGTEKVYTRQDMGIKKAPTRVTTGQKKNVSPLLERALILVLFCGNFLISTGLP